MKSIRYLYFTALFKAVFYFQLFAADQNKPVQDLIFEQTVSGFNSTIQSINTFSCDINCVIDHPKKEPFQNGKYWRSGKTVRVQEGKLGAGTDDYLMKGGEIRQIGRWDWKNRRPTYFRAYRSPSTDFFCICDVWAEMAIEFSVLGNRQISYKQFLSENTTLKSCRSVSLNGRKCNQLSLDRVDHRGTVSTFDIWHDLGYNYMIAKIEITDTKTLEKHSTTLSDFRELYPGIYFPHCAERIEHTSSGAIKNGRTTTINNAFVNQPIKPADLSLPDFPSGTLLTDRIRGVEGKIDSDWQMIGQIIKAHPPIVVPPAATTETPVHGRQSEKEPTSFSAIFFTLGFLGLTCTGIYLIFKRMYS